MIHPRTTISYFVQRISQLQIQMGKNINWTTIATLCQKILVYLLFSSVRYTTRQNSTTFACSATQWSKLKRPRTQVIFFIKIIGLWTVGKVWKLILRQNYIWANEFRFRVHKFETCASKIQSSQIDFHILLAHLCRNDLSHLQRRLSILQRK